MKLRIEKLPHGAVKIELSTEATLKPVVFMVESYQLPIVQQILETARKADKFSFELEL